MVLSLYAFTTPLNVLGDRLRILVPTVPLHSVRHRLCEQACIVATASTTRTPCAVRPGKHHHGEQAKHDEGDQDSDANENRRGLHAFAAI
jgi:hypothetical protein